MAWGSFIKKIKAFGDKAAKTIGSASKYVQQNILPTAKKISSIIAPYVPYGGAIEQGLDWIDTATKKTQQLEDSSDLGQLAYEESGVKDWLNSKRRK
jgi:hypothetical protein